MREVEREIETKRERERDREREGKSRKHSYGPWSPAAAPGRPDIRL